MALIKVVRLTPILDVGETFGDSRVFKKRTSTPMISPDTDEAREPLLTTWPWERNRTMTSRSEEKIAPSPSAMEAEIEALLLSGRASSMAEAESMVLDARLEEIAELAQRLTEEEFSRHELVRLLLAHGSRPWEDSIH
jgi:hypothetical protein